MPDLTLLPTLPTACNSITRPKTFVADADATFAALPALVTAWNVNVVAFNTNLTLIASSVSAAAESQSAAATSAALAGTHAGTATTKAAEASASALTAAQRLADIEALYDTFDDRYLGVKAVDPVVDNDGNALQDGAIYVNSTSGFLRAYNGSAWVQGISALAGVESIDGVQGAITLKTIAGQSVRGAGDVLPAATQAEMEAGTQASVRAMSPQRVAQAIATLAAGGLVATGTAAEAVVAGDPLAWRPSDGKLEKVKRVRQTPWTVPDQHTFVVCPYVDGNTRINTGSSGVYQPRYSIFNQTMLCVWSEFVLDISGTQTVKQRGCVGLLQDDGTVSWGAPADVINSASTSPSIQFDCVVLSDSRAGIVSSSGIATAFYYTIVNISGNAITSASSSGTVNPSGGARSHYMDLRVLSRLSDSKALLVAFSNSGGANAFPGYAIIDYTSTATINGTDLGSQRTYAYGNEMCVGNGDIGGRLYCTSSSVGALVLLRAKAGVIAETTVIGSNVLGFSYALGFDGVRYFVATYVSSTDNRTYAVCIDSDTWSVGAAVQVSTSGFYGAGLWFDASTGIFYLNDFGGGLVYPITRTAGTTLTVGAAVSGRGVFYGRTPSFNFSHSRTGHTQCGTNKFFAVTGFGRYTGISNIDLPGVVLIPYEPTNAANYIGIADANAAINAVVKYTPHGGVTTKMSALTPFREALLSHAGVVGSSGFQRAGMALSATAMLVHTPQNDFTKLEVWTAGGTWICPLHVTKVHLKEVTGGGAGAFSSTAYRAQGGETVSGYLDVVPGQSYTIVIGAGGTSSTTATAVTSGGNTSFGPVLAMGGLHDANAVRSTSQIYRTVRTPILYLQNCTIRRKGRPGVAVSNEIYGGGAGHDMSDYGRAGGYYTDGSQIMLNGTQGVVIFSY